MAVREDRGSSIPVTTSPVPGGHRCHLGEPREYNEAPSVSGIGNFFSLPPLSIRDGIARLLQLPSKLMAQHKFGTRRRAMLSFERQPFPAPCHVDQDVAHSRAWCALRHLTTFDRVLSALHRRNHLPVPPGPCTEPMLPRGSRCGQHLSRPEYTSGPIVTFAPQHTLRAQRVRTLCAERPSEIDVADHRKKPWHSRYPSELKVVTRMFHPAGILMRRNCRRSMSYLIQTDLVRHRGLIIPGLSPNESNAD